MPLAGLRHRRQRVHAIVHRTITDGSAKLGALPIREPPLRRLALPYAALSRCRGVKASARAAMMKRDDSPRTPCELESAPTILDSTRGKVVRVRGKATTGGLHPAQLEDTCLRGAGRCCILRTCSARTPVVSTVCRGRMDREFRVAHLASDCCPVRISDARHGSLG
jgi:hypothetical protein